MCDFSLVIYTTNSEVEFGIFFGTLWTEEKQKTTNKNNFKNTQNQKRAANQQIISAMATNSTTNDELEQIAIEDLLPALIQCFGTILCG